MDGKIKQALVQVSMADLDIHVDLWVAIILFVLPALGATIAYTIRRLKDADDSGG